MIRITTTYKNGSDAQFDFEYYLKSHMRLSKELLGEFGMLSFEIERCLQTMAGDVPDYVCMTHVDFDDKERLLEGLEKHGDELQEDFPNYTNIEPEVQICEVYSTWKHS